MNINWSEIWRLAWPILKEMLVALLMALLALLGYDKYVPSRLARRSDAPSAGSFASGLDLRLRTIADGLNRRSTLPDGPGRRLSESITLDVARRLAGQGMASSSVGQQRGPDARKVTAPRPESGHGGKE